jgi:hypothetical protein
MRRRTRFGGKAARLGALLEGLLSLLAFASPTCAQVIQATGGTSTLFNASGASLELRGPNFSDRFDVGYTGKLRAGFSMLRPFRGGSLDLGDQSIAFALPTDIFDETHYFLGRGAGYSRGDKDHKLFVFAGATANGFFAPYLNVATMDTPTFAAFYEARISHSWRFYSRNAFSAKQTMIQALQWSGKDETHFSLAGGIGNNQPYSAVSFDHTGKYLVADASYAEAGNNFRRVLVQTPQVAEPDRENARLEYIARQNLRFVASRNNYATAEPNGVTARAAVDSFGAWTNVYGFQMYGSWNQSTTSLGKVDSSLLGGRKDITSRVNVGVDYMSSSFKNQGTSSTLLGTIRQNISPRLSLTQLITHTAGQTSVSYGGLFVSNRVSVSAEYETLFFPFANPGTPQFRQVLILGLHFQLPHGIQLDYQTNVDSTGQVRYSAYGTSIGYHSPRGGSGGGPQYAGAFFSNVARGRVVDPSGEPVSGAALQIGKQLAFTDSKGTFLIRLKKQGELPLEVDLDDFTAPGTYAVVSAPKTVQITSEDASQEYKIVVKRVPAEAAQQPPPDPK